MPGPQVPAPRAALYASDNLGLQELQGLCTPDCACALITLNGRKILVASLYFDGTLPIRQAFLEKLFQYADRKDLPMILACDSNSHSNLFGPDQNLRGDQFDQIIMEFQLQVHNNSHTSTYVRNGASSCIDVTLTRDFPWEIDWAVSENFNGSDHRTISFSTRLAGREDEKVRAWGSINWPEFTQILSNKSPHIPDILDQRKLDKLLAKVYHDINYALDKTSKEVRVRRRKNNLWYTEELSLMSREVAGLYKKFRRSSTYGNKYKTVLKKYRKEIWKARRKS